MATAAKEDILDEFYQFEEIDKWAKDFGEKSCAAVEGSEPDEDGELVATFILAAAIDEFASHIGAEPSEVEPIVVRRAASECLMALLRAGHGSVTVSVDGSSIVAITEPIVERFRLV